MNSQHDPGIHQMIAKLSRIDRSVSLRPEDEAKFAALQLQSTSFDQSALFNCMATQTPVLFSDFPIRLSGETGGAAQSNLAKQLADSDATERYKVRFGSSDNIQYLTISEIMARWRVSGTVMGITDLPVRGGGLEKVFDATFLDFCNLMPLASAAIQRLEMLTAVISKAGKLTDSHSDDMAVCNHCFVGKKLWFAWETYEGLAAGIEDVERVEVDGKAHFSMSQFLGLESARWFLVEPGQTIFLPGKFTHRVYTLEDYIGVGSFYITLANVLHTASRWLIHGSLWDPDPAGNHAKLVDDILQAALRQLELQSNGQRLNCVTDALPIAIKHWYDYYAPHLNDEGQARLSVFLEKASPIAGSPRPLAAAN